MRYDWSEQRVREAVETSANFSETLRRLSVPVRGNNLTTLKRYIEIYGIDHSHFTGRAYNRAVASSRYVCVSEYLKEGTHIKSYILGRKLVAEGIKEHRCERCGISEWNGQLISLQLHHIDGDETNNTLENIQLLCPNCHSQTVNYRNKNTSRKRYYCPICGKEISRRSRYCPTCSSANRRLIPVSDEALKLEYAEKKNKLALAKKYGVSESAIRKHLK